jgi:hypothetical protein
MLLVRGNVRIIGTPSGPGVRRRPGHHHGPHRPPQRQHREQPAMRGVHTKIETIDTDSTVPPTNSRGTDGQRAPTADYRPAAADYRSRNEAVPAPAVRPHRAQTTDTDSEEQAGRSLEETTSCRNQRGPSTATGQYDLGHTAIWRGSPQFEDAVSECLDVSSRNCSGYSPGSRRQRPEISRLPGLFRVGSNSVEKLDCSTTDGHMT